MSTLERPEHALAFELRARWADRHPVVLTLTERCVVRRVEGQVEQVAVTGAFVVVDGWHCPLSDVLSVRSPHHAQREAA